MVLGMNANAKDEVRRLTYTADEVAIILKLSRTAVYEAIRRKELPALRFGRRIVVPRAALLRLLGEVDK
jgi:excisionase family DNA binding protein